MQLNTKHEIRIYNQFCFILFHPTLFDFILFYSKSGSCPRPTQLQNGMHTLAHVRGRLVDVAATNGVGADVQEADKQKGQVTFFRLEQPRDMIFKY